MSSTDREKAVLLAYRFKTEASQYITKSKISTDQYDAIDFKFISASTWCALESKVRNMKSTYDSYFIEKHKYDELHKYYSSGVTALYLNYFTADENCFIWDLDQYFSGQKALNFYEKELPFKTSTPEYPNGLGKKIKLVADLPTADVNYKYKFGI